jgi:hypothetical protein
MKTLSEHTTPKLLLGALTGLACAMSATASSAAVYVADPAATNGAGYYLTLLDQLQPGDTLELPAGTYRQRLNLSGLQGTPAAWITITGPTTGAPAIITTNSDCCNNVQLDNTAYLAIKNLTIDSNSEAVDASIDAINASGGVTHDILVENCVITGISYHQQTVGISTKSTAWNWVIRRNRIDSGGTGMYLGNSDGSAPFVNGVIENNLIVDTIGYNVEIKWQSPYNAPAGMPSGSRRTIIRDNVFLKRQPQSSWTPDKLSGIRPTLLVGGFPATGTGADDLYEIYGNFFYLNADGESLFQASGRVAVHDNIFVAAQTTAMYFIDHDLPLRYADVYSNTIFGSDRGVRFGSAARQQSTVAGNLVFADMPISGSVSTQSGNITAPIAQANLYVVSPSTQLGSMNFYPLAGTVVGTAIDLTPFSAQTDFDSDFNRTPKGDGSFRGAYAGDGQNPGWQLRAELKAVGSNAAVRPLPPSNVRVQ